MIDWVAVALRFATYVDLMLLFGLAARPMRGFASGARPFAWLAALGIALTVASFLASALAMMGHDLGALDREMLRFFVVETPMGLSAMARTAALLIILGGFRLAKLGRWMTVSAAIALGSLAWNGHAGASEGAGGWLHLASDIAHLVAGAVWLGALVQLLRATGARLDSREAVANAIDALSNFARVGTVVVVVLIVSGIANLLLIVGIDALPQSLSMPYGQLLALKILLFGGMLALAAVNRWRLTPRLQQASAQGDHDSAAKALRTSLRAETTLAIFVVALVAVLGTLSPTP